MLAQEWRIENGKKLSFLIRHSQLTIIAIWLSRMLAWEWRIENRKMAILNSQLSTNSHWKLNHCVANDDSYCGAHISVQNQGWGYELGFHNPTKHKLWLGIGLLWAHIRISFS